MDIRTTDYGSYSEYQLVNPETGDRVHILPGLGGIIRRLTLSKDGQRFTVLDSPDDPALFGDNPDYAGTFMFPWPSRIKDGVYTFQGETYQLPVNEPARNTAIHGIVHHEPFEVAGEWASTGVSAGLRLTYRHDGSYPGYPFPFDFEVRYELLADGKLEIEISATNTGTETMPVALGWHPYFQLPGGTVDDWTIFFSSDHQILLDDKQMMPGDTIPFEAGEGYSLNGNSLDAIFALKPTGNEARLVSPVQNVTLHMAYERGPGKTEYQVVYTFPDRKRVAIEPLTANVDAFNNGEGLYALKAGDVFRNRFSVYLD